MLTFAANVSIVCRLTSWTLEQFSFHLSILIGYETGMEFLQNQSQDKALW